MNVETPFYINYCVSVLGFGLFVSYYYSITEPMMPVKKFSGRRLSLLNAEENNMAFRA
jgi:hypothetical protein